MTALHFAADRGHSEIADVLLQHGANVNAIDSTGQTALMYAVSCENKVRLSVRSDNPLHLTVLSTYVRVIGVRGGLAKARGRQFHTQLRRAVRERL
jgi:ankyrin repeat protein